MSPPFLLHNPSLALFKDPGSEDQDGGLLVGGKEDEMVTPKKSQRKTAQVYRDSALKTHGGKQIN